MPISITCPDCDARLTLREAPAPRARLKCPRCSVAFAYDDADESETSASNKADDDRSPRPAPRSRRGADQDSDDAPRSRSASRREDSDYEDDRPRSRKRKSAQSSSNTGLIVGLAVGGGLLLLGLLALGGVLLARNWTGGNNQQAGNNNPPVVKPVDNVPPAKVPPTNAPAAPAEKPVTPELYGDQGGEPIAPADAGLPNTLMRARSTDTFFKLSNPRVGQVRGTGAKGKGSNLLHDALLIDYQVVRRGQFDGGTLVITTSDGRRSEVALKFLVGRDQGTIELIGVHRPMGKGKTEPNIKTAFPENAEMYVVRGDTRYRPAPKFMVSNSLTMGVMTVTTRARDWTPQEKERYAK